MIVLSAIGKTGRSRTKGIEMPPEDPIETIDVDVSPKLAHYEDIRLLNTQVLKARNAAADAKDIASAKKKTYEGLAAELTELIAHGSAPLFPVPGPSEIIEHGDDWAQWRTVELSSVDGMPDKAIKAFAEHEPVIVTIGDLSGWQEEKGDFWAKDIKNFGPATREKVEEAMIAFWQTHPIASDIVESDEEAILDEDPLLLWSVDGEMVNGHAVLLATSVLESMDEVVVYRIHSDNDLWVISGSHELLLAEAEQLSYTTQEDAQAACEAIEQGIVIGISDDPA